MNFIKILLLTLLFSILLFVYLEVEKTNNSVMVTQGYKPTGHTIYRDGKVIRISNKEYAKLEAPPALNINSKNNLEKTVEDSKIKTLELSGVIPNDLNYTIKTFYESDSKGYICGSITFSMGIFGGRSGFYLTTSTKVATYSPRIEDGHHNIEIPLDKFDSFFGCNYHLNLIQIKINDSNLKNHHNNMSYGGFFMLFFPNGTSSRNTTRGTSYHHRVGKIINMECTVKDLTNKSSHFSSNCHLKSGINTFFRAQELKYSKYEFNINRTSEDDYKLKLFMKSKEYTSRVDLIKRISHFPKFHEKKLSNFIESIEKLHTYQNRVANYLQETKEGISSILRNEKEQLSSKDIKLLEYKLKTLEKSIQSQQKVMAIEKELLYDEKNIDELDVLNSKIKIDKSFFANEFYKYEMLHLTNLSIKSPYFIRNKIYDLSDAQSEVHESFYMFFLNCRKPNTTLCKKLKNISSVKKEADTKKLLRNIKTLESLLFLRSSRQYYYLLQEFNDLP